MRRPCLDCGKAFSPRFAAVSRCLGCSRKHNAKRNARPERAIYKGAWPAQSRAIRKNEPWCHSVDAGLGPCQVTGWKELTADHPSPQFPEGLPLCRSHHQVLEQRRKKGADRYVAVAERPPVETFEATPRER